jgi:hypothetical protein
MYKAPRTRVTYIIMVVITALIGLSSRIYPDSFSRFLADYLGDILWTAMVYFGLCVLKPSMKIEKLILISLGISYFVEITQLYHAPWIDSIRATRIGGLILGHGFLWNDIICYTIGALFAALIDFIQLKIRNSKLIEY